MKSYVNIFHNFHNEYKFLQNYYKSVFEDQINRSETKLQVNFLM